MNSKSLKSPPPVRFTTLPTGGLLSKFESYFSLSALAIAFGIKCAGKSLKEV